MVLTRAQKRRQDEALEESVEQYSLEYNIDAIIQELENIYATIQHCEEQIILRHKIMENCKDIKIQPSKTFSDKTAGQLWQKERETLHLMCELKYIRSQKLIENYQAEISHAQDRAGLLRRCLARAKYHTHASSA